MTPEIDHGSVAAKASRGDVVVVEADIYADGHDRLGATLLLRRAGEQAWQEAEMRALVNDRWEGSFEATELGFYEFTLEAWIDTFATWREGLAKKVAARLQVGSELLEGAALLRVAAKRARGSDAADLRRTAEALAGSEGEPERAARALAPELAALMARHPEREGAALRYPRVLPIEVERERTRFGAWYEMFPRSAAAEPGRHGTLRDVEARLAYIAEMGFDVLYLPPIHPIGTTHRKGSNNAPSAAPGDPGSPWGIGAAAGGHTAVHPELGTIDDFDRLVERASSLGIEIALDIAFQASPDHPWVREHPDWFRHRADGSIQYAENPPKKYQDIYPIHFESDAWRELWEELRRVLFFWIEHGVRIFRVDNPHTKPFVFWEWLIRDVRKVHADVFFLSEAFTRPKIMRHLARSGFSQSYTYFTWRNTKAELTEYFTELLEPEWRWTMRPNLFTNTPDILHAYLQAGGDAAFRTRLVLAATLGATYGIYGPPFELCVGNAVAGTEEYENSEKYAIRHWDLDSPESLRGLIARMNQIRRASPALQRNEHLRFHTVDNDQLLFYSKSTLDLSEIILVVVNLDPHNTQSGWVEVPTEDLHLDMQEPYEVHDLLNDARYLWHGPRNFVMLDPKVASAHVFRIRQ